MACIATIVIRADRTATPLVTAARNATLDTLIINRGPAGSNDAVDLGRFVAGQPITGGRLVRLGADGLLYYADGPGGYPAVGFVRQSLETGASGAAYQSGALTALGGLTPGARYYLGADGTFSAAAPTGPGSVVQQTGRAVSATAMAVDIHLTISI